MQVTRSTSDLFTDKLQFDSFNDSFSNTLYFTSIPESLNCSLLEPVIQHYYNTPFTVECLTNDEFNIESNVTTTIPLDLTIDMFNCSVFDSVFSDLHGSIASCLNKDSFIDTINSQILYFIAVAIGAFLLGYIMIATFHLSSERQVYKMRLAFYRAVLRQDISWFDLNPAGELSSRLSE